MENRNTLYGTCQDFLSIILYMYIFFLSSPFSSNSRFNGSRAILSGPAGGVVGYALTTYDPDMKQAVIGFDMGGRQTERLES